MKIHIMFRRGHLLYIRQTDMTQGTQIYMMWYRDLNWFQNIWVLLVQKGSRPPPRPMTYILWLWGGDLNHFQDIWVPHERGQVHPRDHKLHTIWFPSTEATRIYMVVGFESYPWLDIWSFLGPGVEWGWP